jgi:curved DNA-binding protein CbpA
LRYHPDRSSNATDSRDVSASTLKFQAVSAAYQILMDEKKRSLYDATGRIVDDDGIESSEDEHDCTPGTQRKRPPTKTKQDSWESFFHSIFHEMISAKKTHDLDAKSYRGSEQEKSDVIKYYNICKGNWAKVAECIAYGDKTDVERWKRDIIGPILKVTSNNTVKKKQMSLEDSSSSEEDIGHRNMKRLKRGISTKRKQSSLDDSTSSEDDNPAAPCNKKKLRKMQSTSETSMSKRDKLEYRTARKQKEKKTKELEVANIFHSKDWGDTFSMNGSTKGRESGDALNSRMLGNLERKYAKSSSICTKKKR